MTTIRKPLAAAIAITALTTAGLLGICSAQDAGPAGYDPAIDYDGDGDTDEADLARAAQNPVADMISLPFQNNFLFDSAFDSVWNLNIQPVIPFSLNDDWNLITRTIFPVLYTEDQPQMFDSFGLGDINTSLFFSPKKPTNGVIWGIGPVFSFPSATDDLFGSGQWSAGPSVVALTMRGPWVFGAIANNLFSIAGDSNRDDVNSFLIQPFVNYNMDDGWYLTSAPIITANWEADSDSRWTVPLGGGVGRVFSIGQQPVNTSLQGYYNVEHPSGGPEWGLRLQFQLLFPK